MAIRVPVGPTVDPSTRPLSPSAPEGVFGIGGDVLGAVGKTAQGVSEMFAQHAEKMAAIDNKIDADTHDLQFQQRVSEFTNKYVAENQGERAEPNLAQAFKDIENIRNETGAGLMSPAARDLYNSQTRIGALQATQGLARFASSEGFRVRNEKIDAQVANTVRGLTADNIAEGAAKIGEIGALKATLNGWSEDQAKAWVADKVGDAAYSIGAGLAPSDPAAAQAFRDKYGDTMSPPQRTALDAQIKASHDNFAVMSTVDAAVAANSSGAGNYQAAIDAREGTGKNPYSTAEGYGQFIKGTWLEVMKDPQFAADVAGKTEKQILDLRKNEGVARRAIELYRQQNGAALLAAGVQPTAANLGLAHGYGAGAAAQILASPGNTPIEKIIGKETARINRVSGLTTAQVVGDFKYRFGSGIETPTERLVTSLPAQLAVFDQTIADPVLREKTKTEYLQRVTRARSIDTAISTEAQNNLLQAALAQGITDPAKLQQAYPGAMEDWARLSPKAQIALQNSLTARGNQWDPAKEQEFNRVMGMAQTKPQQFLLIDPTTLDLPHSARAQIATAQRALQKKSAMDTFKSVNLTRALSNPYVKRGTAKLSDDDYDVFVGALNGELEQWAAAHPGKKPTDAEIGQMGYNLLAQQKRPAGQYVFGVRVGSTEIERPAFSVPPDQADIIKQKYQARYGREPEPDEIARIYAGAN